MVVKHCCYALCNSDSRYRHADYMQDVFFVKFPNPKTNLARCKAWTSRCNRKGFSYKNVTRYTFICSKHFVGGNGPSENHPDPVPSYYTAEQINRLSKKRKSPFDRFLVDKKLCGQNHGTEEETKHEMLITNQEDMQTSFHSFEPINDQEERQQIQIHSSQTINGQELQTPSRPSELQKQNSQMIQAFSPADEEDLHGMFLHNFFLQENIWLEYGTKGWCVQFLQDSFIFKWADADIVKKVLHINRETGKFDILVCGSPLSADNQFFQHLDVPYLKTTNDLRMVLGIVDRWGVCLGNDEQQYVKLFMSNNIEGMHHHTLTNSLHSANCALLTDKKKRCSACTLQRDLLRKRLARMKKNKISKFIGHSYLKQSELVTRCTRVNKEKRQSQKKLSRAKKRIKGLMKNCMEINLEKSRVFEEIVQNQLENEKDDLVKLFMKEQLKALQVKDSRGHRWHPLLLKWCAYIYMKSPATYEALRDSGFLRLPCKRTMYQTMAHFKHPPGFHISVLNDVARVFRVSETVEEHERYVALILDEMSIKADLIYDKESGDIIGFANIENAPQSLHDAIHQNASPPPIATQMLALFVRGLTTSYKYAFAHFPTTGITAASLVAVLWEAIDHLESMGLRVLVITGDGASANRRCFKAMADSKLPYPYKTKNIFASDEPRDIFFIFDPPHLLKTVRNCLEKSNVNCQPRRLWRKEKDMLWAHVVQAVKKCEGTMYRVTWKLTTDHIILNSYSRMNVKLAAQVLSSSTAAAVSELVGEAASETVSFIRTFDRWFDMLNARNLIEGQSKNKPDVNPYKTSDDYRLKWLKDDFLRYLTSWKKEVDERPGSFTPKERKRMLLSEATSNGLYTTVYSTTEVITFLLDKGARYVLTSHLNQDVLEQEFSRQRSCGGWNENPTVQQFGQNAKKLNEIRKYSRKIRQGNTQELD